MAAPIILTPQQCEAVSWAVDAMSQGAALVAIRGLAGTGKTTLIPTLRDQLHALGLPSAVGSPTHRAAMVLRKKGVPDASTIHALALTPYFDGDYTVSMRSLGEDCPCRPDDFEAREPEVNGVPALIHAAMRKANMKVLSTLLKRASRYGAKKALESIGIHGKAHFTGFGPRQAEGVLIIDEASMVGAEMLNLCMTAYPHVICIGDPGQLPPVKDAVALDDVEGFDLTEIHRQAEGSPIIQLAYAARHGTQNWTRIVQVPGSIGERSSADAREFLTSPLIVWRNSTRLNCTRAIRAALGYDPMHVHVGEPLVCRATGTQDRAEGFINNSLWHVVELHDDNHARIQEDGTDGTVEVFLHMEEVDGEQVDPEAVPFRWGYCLTAHTAQGGEWEHVYIHKPDLLAYEARCKANKSDDLQKWAYTAITRAKGTVTFLTQECFITEEPMPQMTTPMEEAAQLALTAAKETEQAPEDDIPAVAVPDGTTTALEAFVAPPTVPPLSDQTLSMANGFSQYVQARLEGLLKDTAIKMARDAETLMVEMANYTKGVLASNEHAAYQLSDALAKVQSGGLTISGSPYAVTIKALTAEGFEVQFTIEKRDAEDMLEELGRLMPWLTAHGYTGITQEAA